MATNRQATARPIEHEPTPAPAGEARRRWVQGTSQIDDPAAAHDNLYESFPARGGARARKPAPEPAPERITYTPSGASGRRFTQQRPSNPGSTRSAIPAGDRLRLGSLVVAGLAGIVALYVVLSAFFSFLQMRLDDMQYGRPRTTHLDAYVGHAGEQAGQPSHFVAMNLDRRIVVIELPGGDTKDATAITGPYLFGDNEDLTPVKLRAEDVNGDGTADLVLTVKNEELVYINDKAKNSFHLLTPEERAKLPSPAGATDGSPVPTGGAQR